MKREQYEYPEEIRRLLEQIRHHEPSEANNEALMETFFDAVPSLWRLNNRVDLSMVPDIVTMYGAVPYLPDDVESFIEPLEAFMLSVGPASVPTLLHRSLSKRQFFIC